MMCLLHNRHGFLDLLLGCLIALRFRLHDRLRRMVHVQPIATEFGTVHLQARYNTLLLAKFQQSKARPLILGIASVLNLSTQLEMVHQLLQTPIGLDVQHQEGATSLFDFLRIEIDRQGRVLRKVILIQLRIDGFHYLIGYHPVDTIDHFRRQLARAFDAMQSGNQRPIGRHLQRLVLIGNHSSLHRDHNQRPVDENRIGQMLGHGHAAALKVLDVANPGHHRTGNVPNRRIETNFVDLTNVPEQVLHLVLRCLRGNIGDLDHLRSGSSASHFEAGGENLKPTLRLPQNANNPLLQSFIEFFGLHFKWNGAENVFCGAQK